MSGRMEVCQSVLRHGQKVVLIKDCYNANLDSMLKVIDFCGELENVGKKIFVLADMKELGIESKKSHEAVAIRINEIKPDKVFFIGPEMKAGFEVLNNKACARWFEESGENTFTAIAEDINQFADNNDVILLKGSHSMQLEKLVPLLSGSGEETKK